MYMYVQYIYDRFHQCRWMLRRAVWREARRGFCSTRGFSATAAHLKTTHLTPSVCHVLIFLRVGMCVCLCSSIMRSAPVACIWDAKVLTLVAAHRDERTHQSRFGSSSRAAYFYFAQRQCHAGHYRGGVWRGSSFLLLFQRRSCKLHHHG